MLKLAALDSLAISWIVHDDIHVAKQRTVIWRNFGWVIQERGERPGKMDAALVQIKDAQQVVS